jgi:hypothetical protein
MRIDAITAAADFETYFGSGANFLLIKNTTAHRAFKPQIINFV